MIDIRNLNEGDAETCMRIANKAFSDEMDRGMDRFNKGYFMKQSRTSNVKLVVAEEKGMVLGFLRVTDANKFVPAQLHMVAIDSGHRGKGIGQKLVQYAMDYVKENSWEKMRLFTRPWNTGMRRICEKLGFVQEGHLRKEYLGEDIIQYGYFPQETS